MDLRRISLILLLAVALCCQAQQNKGNRQQRGRQQLTEYRHKFLAKDLDLTRGQQDAFFPLYDEMTERLEDLNSDFRELCEKADDTEQTAKLSDVALEAMAKRIFEQKKLESEIELEYYARFAEILSKKQLVRLKPAEMKIFRNLSKFHRDRKSPDRE